MKQKRIINHVDQDGKLQIPHEFLAQLGIQSTDELELIIDEDGIKLRKLESNEATTKNL